MTPWTGTREPRRWQREALTVALDALERGENPVIRAATGAGKSVLIAELCLLWPGRVVVTTPSVDLVQQLAGTIADRVGECGTYYTKSKQTSHRVTVVCNASLSAFSARTEPPDLMICDECHKTEAPRFIRVINGDPDDDLAPWQPVRMLGLTATPYRADSAEKLTLFGTLGYNYPPQQAMIDGVIVPPRIVHYTGESRDLDEQCVEMIAGSSGPGVVDAISIEDAEIFREKLDAAGIAAHVVHSALHPATVTARIRDCERGVVRVLVQVSLLVEGVDMPWIRWLCCRRPIDSRVRFAQYVGRGLRSYPGKTDCPIYDPHDLFGRLALDYAALIGADEEDETGGFAALEIDFEITKMNEEKRKSGEISGPTLHGIPARVISPVQSWLRQTLMSLQAAGRVPFAVVTDFSRDAVSQEQHATIAGLLAPLEWSQDRLPWHQRRAIVATIRSLPALTRHDALSLILILQCTVRAGEWPNK